MFDNSQRGPVVPENTEQIQGLLLNPGRGISGPDSIEARESKSKQGKSKKRKISSEWAVTDNNPPLELYRDKTCDLTESLLSNSNDPFGINYDLVKDLGASTSMRTYESRQLMGISDESHFPNQKQQEIEEGEKNNHFSTYKIVAPYIYISKVFENENAVNANPCSGESEVGNMRYVCDTPAIPDVSYKDTLNCQICNKTIDEHADTDQGKKVFKCCFCIYLSNRKSNIKMHIKTHGPDPFVCKICEDTLKEKGSHDTLQICKVCEEKFQCKTLLIQHSLTHTEHCVICWTEVDKHIPECDGEKEYKCCKCEQWYTRKSDLFIHFYTHFEEKPYRCDKCPNRYKSKSALYQHMQTHAENIQ